MDVNSIQALISTVGFPIFCTLALGAFIYKAMLKITDGNRERESKLYELIGKTQEQLSAAQETNGRFLSVLSQINDEQKEMRNDIDEIKETLQQLPKRKTDIPE